MSKLQEIIANKVMRHAAYVRLFNTDDGKVVLRHLMKQGFITDTTFVAGDPHQTAMNEGSRRLVLSILKYVNRDHKNIVNQIEEEIRNDHT
jgi:ribosomal protein S8